MWLFKTNCGVYLCIGVVEVYGNDRMAVDTYKFISQAFVMM